jgi:HlyD family secretion protein
LREAGAVRRLVWIIVLLAAVAGVWFAVQERNRPAAVPFVKATRGDVVSLVATNGRVEPIEWATARAETSGPVERIAVSQGQDVAMGAILVELNASVPRADLVQAQTRITQAKAEMEMQASGGRAADLAEIAGSLQRSRLELEIAQRELASLERLEAKKAATTQEVRVARERVERAQVDIRNLESRRGSLVANTDRQATEARLRDAEAAANLARQRIEMSIVRSPISGTVYQFDLKPGAYLNAGDLVANIGKLDRVHVKLFVDEPDLGRVAVGMPVTITWDAKPGKAWKGAVERMPTQVQAMGTRQVGEVWCVIANPDHELIPGTNINSEVRSRAAQGVISVPKEVLRRDNGKPGVYVLAGDHVEWREVKMGLASVTKTEILEGIREGDALALPTETALRSGMKVTPLFP